MKEDSQFLWINCTNPDHDDTNPSMCVNKVEHNGKPIGFYYCYVCGWHGNMEPCEAKKMAKQKTRARKKRPIDWNKLNEKYKDNLFLSLTPYRPFKISDTVLKTFDIGYDGNSWTFPMRNEYGEIIGIHRRYPNGQKCCVENSTLGLFISGHFSPVMGICEGVSDACVATECGLNTIGLPSASLGHAAAVAFLKLNNINSVVLIGDKGEAGQKSVEKLKNLLDLDGKICYNVVQAEKYKDLRAAHVVKGKKWITKLLLGE